MDRLQPWFALGPAWTQHEPLPGGDLGPGGIDGLIASLREVHAYLSEAHARRLARTYGTRAWSLLGDAKRIEDLGQRVVADLYSAELEHLCTQEWAASADDVLWRRTKLGLVATEGEIETLHAAIARSAPAEKLAG
jgi:glycerol-3-phosphate dehydrogenase